MELDIVAHTPGPATGTEILIGPGSPSVSEMLPAKSRQCQIMGMQNNGLGNVRHAIPRVQPAIAELAVLGCMAKELIVESPELLKEIARQG